MEEEKKKERWIVTYTKHMKQKRKVYHDGFLDLHIPTNKLMLYDESEKLLECRMLKKDEVVTSAETLTFASYFVDVGLLQFPSNLNSSDARRKSNEFRPINLSRSPSQKIIREFKKSELKKYGTKESAPTTTKAGVTEMEEEKERWSVTYTKSIKQKHKVYHDGFLDLHIRTNKLMLYDELDKLLECRMLKKDEVVSSAKTLTSASYLVDVGLLQHAPHVNSSDGRRKSNESRPTNRSLSPSQKIIREFRKSELQKYGTQETVPTTTKAGVTGEKLFISRRKDLHQAESQAPKTQHLLVASVLTILERPADPLTFSSQHISVLYTAQVTQKAKKYHDGFLKLINCGTLQRQIRLYDESKTEINSRFLKKDEVIKSGESIRFDAHIVNIEEAERNHPGLMDSDARVSNCNVAGKSGMIRRVQHSFKTNKSFLKGKPQKFASPKLCADPSFSFPSVAARKSSQNISADKPLRDATQILSVLQKPVIPENTATQSIVNNIMKSVPLVKEPQNSDSTKNIIDVEVSPDIYSKGKVAKSSVGGNNSSNNTDAGSLGQAHLENSESSYTKSCNEASVPGSSSRTVHTSHERVDVMKGCEVENSRETFSCPSFELGFD